VANLPQTVVLLLGNLAVVGGILMIIRNQGRRLRLEEEARQEETGRMLPPRTTAPAGD
jgi:hypothetical protein